MSRRFRKSEPEKEPKLERWLISYADFITLLFAVFVMLYAMSIVDMQKVDEIKASIRSSFSGEQIAPPPPRVIEPKDFGLLSEPLDQPALSKAQTEVSAAEAKAFSRIKDGLDESLQYLGAGKDVQVTLNERGMVVSLKEGGFFPSGAARLQPGALPLLDRIAKSISLYDGVIRIEGHTDNLPISSPAFPSNWELSTARASGIVHYLIARQGFKGEKLSVAGFAEFRPIADNATQEGRRLNRRVDIVMLSRKGGPAAPAQAPGE